MEKTSDQETAKKSPQVDHWFINHKEEMEEGEERNIST